MVTFFFLWAEIFHTCTIKTAQNLRCAARLSHPPTRLGWGGREKKHPTSVLFVPIARRMGEFKCVATPPPSVRTQPLTATGAPSQTSTTSCPRRACMCGLRPPRWRRHAALPMSRPLPPPHYHCCHYRCKARPCREKQQQKSPPVAGPFLPKFTLGRGSKIRRRPHREFECVLTVHPCPIMTVSFACMISTHCN